MLRAVTRLIVVMVLHKYSDGGENEVMVVQEMVLARLAVLVMTA